jgi:hypothetical protein
MQATTRVLIIALTTALGAAVARGQTLDCDTPISASIAVVGQVNEHQLSFDVADGENIAFQMLKTGGTIAFSPQARLLDTNGTPVVCASGSFAGNYYDCGPLPASGNPYRVEVSEFLNNDTGTYDLVVERLSAATACDAFPVMCDETVTGQIDDRLSENLHKFTFNVDDSNNEIVRVTLETTSGTQTGFSARYRLIDGAGKPAGNCTGMSFGARNCGPLLAAGNPYRVQVINATATGSGTYELSVQRVTGADACEFIEAACDVETLASLPKRTASNLHLITPPILDGEHIRVNVQPTSDSPGFLPVWTVIDKTGQTASGCPLNESTHADCGPLSASGNPYRVQVIPNNDASTGSYDITVDRLSASGACEAFSTPCAGSTQADINTPTSVNLHTFTVDPSDAEIVNITVSPITSTTPGVVFNPVWRLIDKDGVLTNDLSCDFSPDSSDCGPLKASGNPYRIEVSDNASRGTGTYELSMQRLTAAAACDPLVLPCDGVDTRTLTPSASRLHKLDFSAVDGELVSVDVQPTMGFGFTPVWRLLDNTGTPVSAGGCATNRSLPGDCGPLSASKSPYRVQVTEFQHDATGDYEISVDRLTAAVACEPHPACAIENRTDSDLFVVPNVVDGATITVNVAATGGPGFLPAWRLIKGDGTPATSCVSLFSGSRSCGPLAATGNPYRIDVKANASNNKGMMSVVVNGQSLCCGNNVVDAHETCDPTAPGASLCCTATCSVAQNGTVCRSSTGACDAAETCTNGACPSDVMATSGTVCRAAAGACDVAEVCDGVSGTCPPDVIASQGTSCRSKVGVCDVAESCTGVSPSCPADAFIAADTPCRSATGVCDVAEACTGTNGLCPADAFLPATTVCRSAVGACDAAETCSGAGGSCPADSLAASGAVCRSAAGACDLAETCDGTSITCPPDVLTPKDTPCGDVPDECRTQGVCSGDAAVCSQSAAKPDGDACNDPTCDPSAGTCATGVCKGTCAGNAQVAGGAGKADIVCTLDDLTGDGKATCTAQGFIPTTASLMAGALDAADCLPGCPSASGVPVTNRRSINFGKKTSRRVKLPTNRNGKQYLKGHDNIDMGVCIAVSDREGRVRRQECRALVSPARHRR